MKNKRSSSTEKNKTKDVARVKRVSVQVFVVYPPSAYPVDIGCKTNAQKF